jgi:hypothetical protein
MKRDAHMNNLQLMIHVERIVRPVRAFQSRKLRMRRELLAHLQAAVGEECAKGLDESSAMEQATRRLGECEELTRGLQRTVPLAERVLMAKVPTPRGYDRWEKRAAARIWGWDRPMTFGHILILAASATALPYIAYLWVALTFAPSAYMNALANRFQQPVAALVVQLLLTALAITLIGVAARFLVAVAAGRKRSVLLAYAVAIESLLMEALVLCSWLARGKLTGYAITRALVISVGLVIVLAGMGKLVGMLRKPYDEWLSLELGE